MGGWGGGLSDKRSEHISETQSSTCQHLAALAEQCIGRGNRNETNSVRVAAAAAAVFHATDK